MASLVKSSSTSPSPNNRRQVLQIGATLAISGVRRIVLNTHLGMGDVYTLKILSVIITEKKKEGHKRTSKDIKGWRKTNKDIKGQVRT